MTKNSGIGPSDKTAMLISIKNYTKSDNDLRLVNPDDNIFEICMQRAHFQIFHKLMEYKNKFFE